MERTFSITPSSASPLIFISVLVVLAILLAGFFAFIGYPARNTKFEVTEQGLRIKGSIYGRLIPREELAWQEIRLINLNAYPESEYQPKIRMNGIGLPGYAAGWFRLKNKEKALLFVTDRSRVVYIPTKQGYVVMLSVSNPAEFRQAMELWR